MHCKLVRTLALLSVLACKLVTSPVQQTISLEIFHYCYIKKRTFVIFLTFSNSEMPNKGYETITNDEEDAKDSCHPSMSANFLSLLSFWWMNSVFKIGSKRPLKQSDFLPLHEKDRTRDLTERLQKEWNNHVQECNSTEGRQPKLWKCVLRTISCKEILFLISFWLFESVCRVSQPLVLGFLLRLLSCRPRDRPLANAFCFLLSLSGLSTALTHYSAYRFELLGMRLSSAIKGIVYLKVRKSLLLAMVI